mmetsp:Transcript_69665/g.220608  ORF Transcript_69665/g.220608 Transcript_69665/m.220608 type:complete len:111 (-) Transcript_69665:19-351(-)
MAVAGERCYRQSRGRADHLAGTSSPPPRTWQQLGFSKKPVGLLNINGYYDRLLAFFDHSVEEGFIRSESRAIVISAATPGELLDKLQAHIPPEDLISLATRGALDENQRG